MNLEIRKILVGADRVSVALKRLYSHRRSFDPKFSYSFMCKRLALKSKGSISDLFSGRSKLKPSYANDVCKLFNLDPFESEYLRVWVQHENHSVDSRKILHTDSSAGCQCVQRLHAIEKILSAQHVSFEGNISVRIHKLACDVFCSFGVLGEVLELADICDFFQQTSKEDIHASLKLLEDQGLIRLDGQYYHCSQKVALLSRGSGVSPEALLRLYIAEACDRVDELFSYPDICYFQSFTISTKWREYQTVLKRIKTDLQAEQANLQRTDGDSLVRFNVQVFPIARCK